MRLVHEKADCLPPWMTRKISLEAKARVEAFRGAQVLVQGVTAEAPVGVEVDRRYLILDPESSLVVLLYRGLLYRSQTSLEMTWILKAYRSRSCMYLRDNNINEHSPSMLSAFSIRRVR